MRIFKQLAVAVALTMCFLLAGTSTASAAVEPWYTYLGLGWSDTTYPGELEDAVDAMKDDPGIDTVSISLDLGFYRCLQNKKSLFGLVLNAAADRFSADDDWLQINSYLLGVSAMHFFGPEPGSGLFFRGDLGMAWHSADSSSVGFESSDMGYGGLVGIGYGIPVSEGTRILLNVNYALRSVEGDDTTTLGISIGGLF